MYLAAQLYDLCSSYLDFCVDHLCIFPVPDTKKYSIVVCCTLCILPPFLGSPGRPLEIACIPQSTLNQSNRPWNIEIFNFYWFWFCISSSFKPWTKAIAPKILKSFFFIYYFILYLTYCSFMYWVLEFIHDFCYAFHKVDFVILLVFLVS